MMFVKIDHDHWVNMFLVETVFREGDILNLVLNDGRAFTVTGSHEPEVFKAMKDMSTILLRFKVGTF